MHNIEFKISKNILSIGIVKKEIPKVNLNDTNIIDTKDMVFSMGYIEANLELVASFLNVVMLKRDANKVIIKDYEIILLVLKILNLVNAAEELTLKPDRKVNYPIFMALLSNRTLKKIDVYDIPHYLLERLDVNKDLKVTIRSEILFVSSFMGDNNLTSYSEIYYAKSIEINNEFILEDYEDIRTFMDINKYLKTVYINKFISDTFIHLFALLKEFKKEDIKIVLKEESNDLNNIFKVVGNIKKRNEKYIKENNIVFKINYSAEFKRNNIFKQLNLNFLRISTISTIVLIVFLMCLNFYKNYAQELDIKAIENELKDIISAIDKDYNIDDQDDDIEHIGPDDNLPITTTKKPASNYVSSYYKNYAKVFDTLLKINKDTKGWLTINNTRIDYPVVQAKDNDYYLKRDFNKYKNSMGWIFIDYRNNINDLNQNTIIYGHNINGGIMFGTLRYALNSSWYTNKENQVITFNTLNAAMKWQIFSIYKIPNTTDYLIASFYDDKNYENFLNKITKRSVYDFKQTLNAGDKILTLSTCQNQGQDRLVVHAKLIKEDAN